jgi:hypothetical protein
VYKGSCFAASSPAFVAVIVLDYGYSNWGEMKSKCCFDVCVFKMDFGCKHWNCFTFKVLDATMCSYPAQQFKKTKNKVQGENM